MTVDFDPSDLFRLRNAIDSYLKAADLTAQAYCEGWNEWEELDKDTAAYADKLRNQIRNLAIDLDICADFLAEYSQIAVNTYSDLPI